MSSENLFDRLSKEGKLKRQKADIDYLNALLDAARRNFEAALVVRGRVDEAARKHRPIAYYRIPAGVEVDFVIETSRRRTGEPAEIINRGETGRKMEPRMGKPPPIARKAPGN